MASATGSRPVTLNLRLRIALTFAVTCIAIASALGFTLYSASEELENDLVEQLLNEEIAYLIDRAGADAAYRPTTGPNLQYYIVRTPADEAQLPAPLRKLAAGYHDVGSGAAERHVEVRETGGTRFIVAYDVGAHELREERFRTLIVLSTLTVALGAFALGYWLAGVLTRQLTDLGRRVAQLDPLAPHELLARQGQDSEIAGLARTLDDYQARISRMMRREQEFTANASHELRTPLTAIRTSCELLAGEPALSPKAHDRLAIIGKAAEHMTGQLQVLLYLAREQDGADTGRVVLAECVADAVEPYRAEIADRGLRLETDIGATETLELDRQALHLVLSNLLRNAVHHTARGAISVRYAARRLTVADTGSGIAAAELPRVFERYYRGEAGSDGLGLGLAIVKRICDRFGWRVEASSIPEAGSEFTVVFP
jgi:signal transduction histidine kinase